jgi:serine/threonine-protein kinase
MQWVEGRDLKRLLEMTGRLHPDRAVAIASQVGGALDAVHGVDGLVHRDVKPANVLLRDVGIGDHAYLTDFGVAKPSESSDQLTRTGWVVGTSGYLSPEQIRGQEPGPRSDLYALGCLFFEALTGRPPFIAENEMALRWAHANDPRPLVSAVVPEVGARYDRFVSVALAVDPGQRFGSGREFVDALAAAHAGDAVVASAAPVIDVPHAPTAVGPPTPVPPGVQTPLPPTPGYPVYAYATPPPAYPERSRSGSPLALILLALTALAGIAAGVLAAAGVFTHQTTPQIIRAAAHTASNKSRPAVVRHHPDATVASRQPTQSSSTSGPPAVTTPAAKTQPGTNLAASGAPPIGTPAGDALQLYWTLINTGHYRRAFLMETPHEMAQEPSFVSDKKTAQPMINVVSIGQPSSNSGASEVPIAFYAQDRYPSPGSDTICRYFQMSADLVQVGNGSWAYDGPVSGTAQVTTEPGNPNCHS